MAALPDAFVEKMKGLLGAEADAFLASYARARGYGLRRNPCKCGAREWEERMPFHLTPVPWAEGGYYYEPEEQPGKHPFHEAGAYYIQEPSAMLPVEILSPRPGERVCDLCAAPGGKSTQIAGKMRGEGLLVANEVTRARARVLSRNFERMGVTNGVALNEDTGRVARLFPGFFDKVCVDAPCSGEGMFRKDEEARNQWSKEQVSACARRQRAILEDAARICKPGGVIVYSTCTFSPEENEGVVARFILEHPEFRIADAGEAARQGAFSPGRAEWSGLPDGARPEGLARTVRVFPHLCEGEGHFAAKLVREEGAAGEPRKRVSRAPKCRLEEWRGFMEETGVRVPDGAYRMFGGELYLTPQEMPVLDGVRVERAGLHLGTVRKNRFEPSHALALSLRAEGVRNRAELSVEEAARYLRGETFADGGENGWTLVCVEGFPLGWGKRVGGVVKNHYPKGLRR